MVLTKYEITEAVGQGGLSFSPNLDKFQLQPHAVDLRLGFEFKIPKTWEVSEAGRSALIIDPLAKSAANFETLTLKPGQYFELLPREFVIGTTLEEIAINRGDLMAVLYPRSSINRRGLSVALSGIIDVGYAGKLMIPLINNTQQQIIRVYPGERICQIVFSTLSRELSSQDAQLHGVTQAKYHLGKDIESKSDSEKELELIRQGKIADMKKNYPVEVVK